MTAWDVRLMVEYMGLKYRYEKLCRILDGLDAGTLEFTPRTPQDVLVKQKDVMKKYLDILEYRAKVEGVYAEFWEDA